MIEPRQPNNESERLASLYRYQLLDTLPEEQYDNITRIASEICKMPMSLISLVDDERLFHKAATGIEIGDAPRSLAFCSHTILTQGEIMVVPDSSKDARFHDNPFVTGAPHVGFYAGVPLVTDDGYPLGALCVLDTKPNDLTPEQKGTLQALAKQAVTQMELRKKNIELEKKQAELELLNKELERFAYVAAHDLKSPCNNLAMLSMALKEMYGEVFDEDGLMMLDGLQEASGTLAKLVDGILQHTRIVNETEKDKERFSLGKIAEEIKRIISLPKNFSFTYDNGDLEIFTGKTALQQVLLNLCVNAVKYNDKHEGSIILSADESAGFYHFKVTDNGPGIPPSQYEKIFELFTTLGTDTDGNKGNGIGLSTVKRLVEKHGGSIKISSKEGEGSSFQFTIAK